MTYIEIIAVSGVVLSFILGYIFAYSIIYSKRDGRLIITKDGDYFVAITIKPEDLEKKKRIHLKVITR